MNLVSRGEAKATATENINLPFSGTENICQVKKIFTDSSIVADHRHNRST
jgi:hypothetical protein